MNGLTVLAVAVAWLAPNEGDATIERAGRQATVRAIAYMETDIEAWNKEHACVSCHNAMPIVWGLQEARAAGFEVAQAKLDDWLTKSRAIQRRLPAESLAYLILGGAPAAAEGSGYDAFAGQLKKARGPDNGWRSGGQRVLEKRRARRSADETTLWSLLALAAAKAESDAEAPAPSAENVEQLTARLLLDLGRDAGESATDRGAPLRALQNEDGGWGWRAGAPSDAIATGQALYALASLDFDGDRAIVEKGVRWLVAAQKANGSWTVDAPLDGWNEELTKHSVYWATAWAAMGLSRTLAE